MISKIKEKARALLLWSQKYTKTDMLYLAKGGFWLSTGQALSTLISFLLAIAFANLLTKDAYGTYRYILSIAGILSALTLTGMNTAVTQAVAKGHEGTLKKSVFVQLKWGILLILAALGGSIYYFIHNNQTIAISLLIIGSLYPILTSANTYAAFLGGKKDFKRLTKYGIAASIINSLSVFIALFITQNPLWLVVVYLLSSTLTNLFYYLRILKFFKPNDSVDSPSISYGKHLSLINVMSVVASYLDKLLIYHYLGAADVAIYTIATAPPEHLKGLFKNISSLALPKLSENSKNAKDLYLTFKTFRLFLIVLAVAIVYILAAPLIFKIFFPAYQSSVFLSQIFALSLATAASVLPSSYLSAREAKKELYNLNIITSIIQIALYLFLIPIWGLIGIILARVIYRYLSMTLNMIYAARL